jgi:lipopolysaccharide export system protein LptA
LRLVLAAAVAIGVAGPVVAIVLAVPAGAQQLDLSHGGPIDITAREGIEWRQAEQEVIARGDAKAVRGTVTVSADRLTAWYRKKGAAAVSQPAPAPIPAAGLAADTSTEGNEIYRLQADGHVRIFTATDQAQGDKATYDIDQSVLVMTGHNLKLTTPSDTITARDDLEYWPQKRMAVARGDAVVVTSDAKRVAADTLVAYTADNAATAAAAPASSKTSDDPLAASGKLQRVEAFGNVSVRTATDTVTGDRGVYVPDTGMARLGGNVRITRGQNQLNGAEANVNMKTGVATLVAQTSGRVHGLVVPNDETNKSLGSDSAAKPGGAAATGAIPGGAAAAGSASAPAGQKP